VKTRRKVALAVFGVLLDTSSALALELPNDRLTPGAIGSDGLPAPTAATVCVRGYARSVRHRYDGEWRRYRVAMFREYGIRHEQWSRYTVDHLVPIELGGRPFGIVGNTWDLRNVWPEPKVEAEQKDAVENALHEAVCYRGGYRGVHLSLRQAESAIAHDWTRTSVGLPSPRKRPASLSER
jgi:hypothetical protein